MKKKIGRWCYLVLSFQGDRIDLADVVGFRGGIIVVSVFDDIARAVVSEVRHRVVEKGNCPEKKEDIFILKS